MVYVLGIDGGGTKTKGVVSTSAGKKIAEVQVGATNPNIVSKETLRREISSLISQLRYQIGEVDFNQIRQVFAGVSGAGHPTSRKKLIDVIAENVPQHIKIQVDHDAIIDLYSGTLSQAGIVQISGTGSVTYGVNTEGLNGRVGGWGHLLGERGSGYSIGHDALVRVFQGYDGIRKQSSIKKDVLRYFHVQSPPELVYHIYNAENMKENVAALSRYVMKAADCCDEVAKSIIHDNGQSIGRSITCLIEKIFADERGEVTIPVVLTGGVFNRFDLLQSSIEAVL